MLADTFPIDQQGSIMGTVLLFHTVGFMLGPVVGGFLYDYYGTIASPFYFCSVFPFCTLIGTICIAEPMKKKMGETTQLIPSSTKKKLINNKELFQLLRHRQIISCIICCFVTSAALSGIEPALPIYLGEKYHVSISTVGGNVILKILTAQNDIIVSC